MGLPGKDAEALALRTGSGARVCFMHALDGIGGEMSSWSAILHLQEDCRIGSSAQRA